MISCYRIILRIRCESLQATAYSFRGAAPGGSAK
jgi:hypothetical protein